MRLPLTPDAISEMLSLPESPFVRAMREDTRRFFARMAKKTRREMLRMNRRQRKAQLRNTHWLEADGETRAEKPRGLTAARASFLRHLLPKEGAMP